MPTQYVTDHIYMINKYLLTYTGPRASGEVGPAAACLFLSKCVRVCVCTCARAHVLGCGHSSEQIAIYSLFQSLSILIWNLPNPHCVRSIGGDQGRCFANLKEEGGRGGWMDASGWMKGGWVGGWVGWVGGWVGGWTGCWEVGVDGGEGPEAAPGRMLMPGEGTPSA